MKQQQDHWLVRPRTIKILWIMFSVVLALLVGADFFVAHHSLFGVDGLPSFSAVFGFISCVILVFGAKALGLLLKKPEDYYDR